MAFIQQKAEQSTSSVASFTTTAMTTGAGNSIVACMGTNGGSLTSLNASDSKSDSYTNGVVTNFTANTNVAIGWAKNIAGGSTTFTATPNSARFCSISAQEYGPLGASSEATNTGSNTGTSISPGAVNPASANDLYVACWSHGGAANETFTFNVSGEGWSQRSNLTNTTNQPLGSQDLIASGSKTGSATASGSVQWQAVVATFQTLAVSSTRQPMARTIKTDRTLTPGDGGQRTFSPRRAMSGTRIQEAFSGASVANSTLSAAGDATASFVGAAQDNSVLAAAGDATATFTGASKAAAVLSAAGDATATFTGAAKAASVLSAAADATASFTGAAQANSTLSGPGDSTASFTGAALDRGLLNAPGDSSLSFVGRADAAAVWNAAGDASAAWIGSTGGNVLSADGDSSAIFVGAELAAAVLAAAGDSSALWSGTFTVLGGNELGARRPMRGRSARKPPKQRRPIYRHPEELERERRMLEQYLESLQTKARPASEEPVRPGESQEAPTRRAEPVAPRLSDVMARLASAQQLEFIARAERVAKEDRAKAQKEHKRRRVAAIAVLMMSH